MNNYMDRNYDKNRHSNPLIHGLKSRSALLLLLMGAFLTFCFSILYTSLIVKNVTLPLLLLIGAIIFGILYNAFSKRFKMGIFLSIYICLLTVFGYSFYGSAYPPILFFVAFYAGLQVYFQVNIEGSLKDIDTQEVSFAREQGCVVGYISTRFILLSVILKFLGFYTLLCIVIFVGRDGVFTDITVFAIIVQLIALYGILKASNRNVLIAECGIMEISTYSAVIFALSNILRAEYVVCLVVFPILWYIGFNKFLYGNWMKPKV